MVTEYMTQSRDEMTARLLVVDDEPNIRAPLVRALSLQGYYVEEAASGQEALTLLKQTPYNLMVLDMRMPGIGGVEVMSRARQLYSEISIIVLTGHATVENAIAAVKSEAVDYLLKPARIKDILSAVNRALQKHPPYHPPQSPTPVMDETPDTLPQPVPPPPPANSKLPLKRFVRAHPLILDRQTRLVAINIDTPYMVELTAGETAVLTSLMIRPGQVLSCVEVVRAAWGDNKQETEAQNLVRPHISRLRRKLESNPKIPRLIYTVRRRGYYFASIEE